MEKHMKNVLRNTALNGGGFAAVSSIIVKSQAVWLAFCLALVAISQPVLAALPTPTQPSTAPAQGDFIGWLKGTGKDVGLVIGLLIAIFAFCVCAWAGIAKFNECRKGRAEWADMLPLAGGAVASVGACVFFLNIASTII
jgi:integrating conjugative element membrane protein (TIGR03745 family)